MKGLGFRVLGLGGLGFRVLGLGGLGFKVVCSGFADNGSSRFFFRGSIGV